MSGNEIRLRPYWRQFIDGKWCDARSGGRIAIDNPATGETLAEVARAGTADVDAAVAAARRSAGRGALADLTPSARMELMFRIAAEIERGAEEIALAECLDNGKRWSDARKEAAAAARYFTYFGGLADKFGGRSVPLGPDYIDYTLAVPFGVSGHIVPWNYPINIAARSLSCALATGNCVVLKSPELSPISVCLLVEACERAGVPSGAVNLLCGFGGEAGAALVAHPGIDHIVFTGSVATGQAILRSAAERIVPCTMELGGKSAGIVFADADIENAVQSTLIGLFSNSGQICSAASRLLVHRSIYGEIIERLAAAVSVLRVGAGIEDAEITPLISRRQLERVESFCHVAERDGARQITGGRRVELGGGYFMAPSVYADVRVESALAREEVFGPVLAVLPFDSEAEAIDLANSTEYGLVAGIYTRELARAHRVAARLIAGQVFVNEWFAGGVETPFGGVGRSGYGREKGIEALSNYTYVKNIAIRLRHNR